MATATVASDLAKLLADGENTILKGWLDSLQRNGDARISAQEVESQARDMLRALTRSVPSGGVTDIDGPAFQEVRDILEGFSRTRALQGFSPTETAIFVFSMKEPLFEQIRSKSKSVETAAEQTWALTRLLDKLGLFAVEAFQRTREELIARQREEIEELSTPVVKLWDGVLALPLIGTLDSARTQVVMQNLLESIVREGAEIAILDITGVPTVDTLVAQHLLKTVSAARLMGADCIISGIRPQIAQTIVQLGVQLNVVSKATLADAFAMALTRTGRKVVKVRGDRTAPPAGE
ncbi:MAG: STAS domain-containing protein [Reyranellales bacterium]|jgi:rsbT co-antagonist protein RsbR